ncbi:MAG TPA: hypothetical protein VFI11_14550, partial [Anaerolineales bacterium]|nr:hypothetical protein [Anaerolineales bacterium]
VTSLAERSKPVVPDPDDVGPPTEESHAPRLLVLVSEEDADDMELPQRIWMLADQRGAAVALLGLYSDDGAQASVRRQLVSLAAAIRDRRLAVETLTHRGSDWVQAVETLWRPGDLIVCTRRLGGERGMEPSSQLMNSRLQVPIHVFAGAQAPVPAKTGVGRWALTWAGNLGLLVAFFWLQVQVDRLPGAGLRVFLLVGAIAIEVCVLWVWNSLAG